MKKKDMQYKHADRYGHSFNNYLLTGNKPDTLNEADEEKWTCPQES